MNPDQFIPPFKYIDGEKAKASFLSMVDRISKQPDPGFSKEMLAIAEMHETSFRLREEALEVLIQRIETTRQKLVTEYRQQHGSSPQWLALYLGEDEMNLLHQDPTDDRDHQGPVIETKTLILQVMTESHFNLVVMP